MHLVSVFKELKVDCVSGFTGCLSPFLMVWLILSLSSGVKAGISKKDKLFNDLVDWMEERKLQFRNAENAQYITQVLDRNLNLQFFYVNPLPDNKILDWSELKQIAHDTLKCI